VANAQQVHIDQEALQFIYNDQLALLIQTQEAPLQLHVKFVLQEKSVWEEG
jgi:hypothetical protein